MIARIRQEFEALRDKKHHRFDDFERIVQRCFREYAHLFPSRQVTKKGSKFVFHPNIEGLNPISVEKEHGSRDSVPKRYAKFAMAGIDALICHIEESPDTAKEQANEDDARRTEENDVHQPPERERE